MAASPHPSTSPINSTLHFTFKTMKHHPFFKLCAGALLLAAIPQAVHAATGDTAYGTNALQYNTGNYNSAFGYQALRMNTTGTNNVGTGLNALFWNTTGSGNSAHGTERISTTRRVTITSPTATCPSASTAPAPATRPSEMRHYTTIRSMAARPPGRIHFTVIPWESEIPLLGRTLFTQMWEGGIRY